MTYPHPLRGTCVPECQMFGSCHCGCGGKPIIYTQNESRLGRVKGMPLLYVRGHNPKRGRNVVRGVRVGEVRDGNRRLIVAVEPREEPEDKWMDEAEEVDLKRRISEVRVDLAA